MATNSIKTRIINKHDIEANWNLATNFIPNKGELIIYDKDTNYDYPRLKIGDGSTKVGTLPFIDKNLKINIENISAQIVKFLEKTTYEYNKELNLGQTGYVCIGKFPMYDSLVTVEIKSSTSSTYNGTLVIASQNINTSGGGAHTETVYGDASNTLTNSIKIHYGSGSNVFSVYIQLPGWSKNLLHIQCSALAGTPTDIATMVTEIPSNATITPINALVNNYTTLSTTQTISGAKTFTGGIVANSIISGSGIINNTTIGSLGWNSAGATNANNLRLINVNTLAYWDGSYDGTTSNLTRLGTIKTGTWNGNTIAVGYGGTGTSTAPKQGGIIYGASTSAYGCTAAGTSGYVLKSNGTGAPTWLAQSSIAAGSAIKDGSGNTITSYYLPKANVSGTANYIPKFTAANSVGNSRITDDGTTIVLGGNTSINGSSGDTGLYVKSASTGSYIGIINSSNTTLGFFGYSSANVPVVYYSSAAHRIINASDGTGTVGSSTKPIYANGGVATACSYDLNVANSTNTSSKIFLIGATAQGSNQTTYSHDTTYVDTSASLHSTSFTIAAKAKLNYNTTDNCIEFTFA